MTREEITNSRAYQVSKAALEYYNEHYQDKDVDLTDTFEDGAKWADKTMIEKACEWLETELYTTHDNCGYKVTASFNSVDKRKFIEEFRKAMEEQL